MKLNIEGVKPWPARTIQKRREDASHSQSWRKTFRRKCFWSAAAWRRFGITSSL